MISIKDLVHDNLYVQEQKSSENVFLKLKSVPGVPQDFAFHQAASAST
jgi:hypothetical protein